jgi:hypothetical protein
MASTANTKLNFKLPTLSAISACLPSKLGSTSGKTTDLEPKDIIKAAGIQRFRPIILTTLTTFFGLAPMILETSQDERLKNRSMMEVKKMS